MSDLQVVSFYADTAYVVPGSTITVTCKLKNISGLTLRRMSVGIGIPGAYAYALGGYSSLESIASWSSGKTRTFTWTVTLPTDKMVAQFVNKNMRQSPLTIEFAISNYSDSSYVPATDTYVANSVIALNKFYQPRVEEFRINRTPDDEGDKVLVSIKIAQVALETGLVWNPTCTLLYKAENEDAISEIDLTSRIPELLEGITDSADIVTAEILPQYDCDFEIVFGDDFESASRLTDVPNAFANFALSETGAGASFGMFPTSTADEPKLESAYPGYLYSGIVNFGGGEYCTASQQALGVQSGEVSMTSGVSGGNYSDTDVTFPVAYKIDTIPVVVVGFRTSSDAAAFGNCACSAHSVSSVGFKIRFFNGDTTKRAPGFNWIAVGQA